jgi:hypothetical protein
MDNATIEFQINQNYVDPESNYRFCATTDSSPEDIFEPDEVITKITSIEIDITCNPYMCGVAEPVRAFSEKGFTRLDFFKLIAEGRRKRGICDHRFIEFIEGDDTGKFDIALGS